MAAPRKKARRDYKAEYARRNARARQLGFRGGYYDRRIHGGDLSAPTPSGSELRRRQGKASGGSLRSKAGDGDLAIASMGGRDREGRYRRVDITLIGDDGSEDEFTLRGRQLEQDYLQRLVEDLERAGVIFSPAPSLDLRRIADEAKQPTVFVFVRRDRYLAKFSVKGAALTTADPGKALSQPTLDDAMNFYRRRLEHLRGRARFAIEEVEEA